MRIRTSIILVAALALCGCASIPLSTAFHLASLSPHTLAQIDPAQVRVKVSVPLGYEINVHASHLTLELSGPSGSRSAAMGLAVLSVTRESRSGGLFHPNIPVSTYLLALNPDGTQKLRKLEQFVLSSNPKHFEFGVLAPLAKVPRGAREVTLWAGLKLWPHKPFMSLIDGATLRFGQTRSGS